MSTQINVEPTPLENLQACFRLRKELGARVQKGEAYVANLLASTDAENPVYIRQKERLDNFRTELQDNEYHIWLYWRLSGERMDVLFPKNEISGVPLGLEFNPAETDDYIFVSLTWDEYVKFIGQFLCE